MADVIYSVAQGYDLAYDQDKARIEVAMAVTARPFLETYRGHRVLDENRIEVYVDYWHFEENLIAAYSVPSGLSMPWEVLAAMDDLVFNQRRAAYSDTAASRFNVPWISLVMDRDARLVQRALSTLQRNSIVPSGYFNVGGASLVSAADARARYQASIDWFDERGHLVISNGPFSLWRYDPPAQYAELRAFREANYPFKPGDWYFGEAPQISIAPPTDVSLTGGTDAEVSVTVEGPGTLGLRYLLFDPAAREVVDSGEARGRGGSFTVDLSGSVTRTLFPGLYELNLIAYSDAVARVEERTVSVDVR
jgi:peptide/nickel transport system substrate-binding protein